jgi:hypothetical protein
MASAVVQILEDLVATLRTTGMFHVVTLGQGGSETAVPRASVLYDGQDSFPPDDSPDARWVRVRVTISVRTRSLDFSQAIARAEELCEQTIEALLEDSFRNGHCEDLPVGRATEICRHQVTGDLNRPEVEMSLGIRCHFQAGEAG